MALRPEIVTIPFTGGLETKADEKVVLPTKLTVLDNGEFTKRGTVRCRPGHFAMTDATVRGTLYRGVSSPQPRGTKLGHATRDDELLLLTDEYLYSADEATKRWMPKGAHYPVITTTDEVAAIPVSQANPVCATAGHIRCVAWDADGVHFSLYNSATGATYAANVAVSGGADTSRPTVVPLGSNLVLLWADHNTFSVRGLLLRGNSPVASLTAAEITFVGDLASSYLYAVTTDETDMYITYHADGSVVAGGVAVAKLSPQGVTAWKQSISTDTPSSVDVTYNADAIFLVWYNGADVVSAEVIDGTLDSSGAVITLASVTAVACGPKDGTWAVAWESPDGVTLTGTDAPITIRQSYLVSSGFQFRSDGRCVFILGHESRTGLQNSFYLYDDAGLLVGQVLYQTATDPPTIRHLARVSALETALGFRRRLEAPTATPVYTQDGISRVVFDPSPQPSYAEAGGTAYLSGSCLWAYDGTSVAEANLLMYPDLLTADLAKSNGTGSLTNSAQYSYKVFYEVLRANGERVRSAALIRSITLGASDDTVTLTIPTLPFTRRQPDAEGVGDVVITVYRNVGNDQSGLYYRVSSSDPTALTGNNRYVLNDTTADTVTFVDGLSDALLLGGDFDYLSTGEIEHIAPPGPAVVVGVADRLFLAGGQVPKGTVRYSKLRFFGEPAEFSDILAIDDLPEAPGRITSLSYINETLVVLRELGVSAVAGEGVDNTATSGGYVSEAVSSDVGGTGASVVTPQGLMFASTKGIYLLDQSFNVSYIGAPVERYNSQTYTGGVVIPGTNQVLFLTESGSSLMYDYHFGEWAAWTLEGAGLVLWKKTVPAFLRTDGLSLYRDVSPYADAIFTDANSTYDFRMRTGPLRLTDCLQAFARLWRFQVLGTYTSAHKLLIGLYYDRDTAPYESIEWDPETVIVTSRWGSDATWGSSEYWGGSRGGDNYQFEHIPRRQTFSTIRFEFSMIPGTDPGAGYELTELALLVGVKPGLQRRGVGRKY